MVFYADLSFLDGVNIMGREIYVKKV